MTYFNNKKTMFAVSRTRSSCLLMINNNNNHNHKYIHRLFIRNNMNIFQRLITRKNKNYDPRKKTIITERERYFRGFIFSMYGFFVFFLFIPGSNYKINSKIYNEISLPSGIILPTGIQYKILKKGYGEKIKNKNCNVYVKYQGSLLNGKIFTTTKNLKKPIKFDLNSVIPGISQGIINMKIGEERQIFIPSKYGYSRYGKLNNDSLINIPPNVPLIFNIQLCGFD